MVRGYFTSEGHGSVVRIKGIWDQMMYKNILFNHARPAIMGLQVSLFSRIGNQVISQKNKEYLYGPNWQVKVLQWPLSHQILTLQKTDWSTRLCCKKNKGRAQKTDIKFLIILWDWERLNMLYAKKLVDLIPKQPRAAMQAKWFRKKYYCANFCKKKIYYVSSYEESKIHQRQTFLKINL